MSNTEPIALVPILADKLGSLEPIDRIIEQFQSAN
jgi:hypothetical protein